jgi:DNA-binding NarL/FixJ family response regulator
VPAAPIIVGMIRVAVLDDHPAVLAGLRRLIERAPDLEVAAAVETQTALWRELDGRGADVVIVDYDVRRGNGLSVCDRLKRRPCPPRVVIYSAYAGQALTLAAHIARADALVDKSAPAGELLAAVRQVAAGESVLPDVDLEVRVAAMRRLRDEELPVAAMLIAGTSYQDIAEALGIERREVARRAGRILATLRPGSGAGDADPALGATPALATRP